MRFDLTGIVASLWHSLRRALGRGQGPVIAAPAPNVPHARPAASPGDAFTPTRPKPGRRHVVGRAAERSRILQAILEEHAHVVLYCERGRGKTSLANYTAEALRRAGCVVGRYTCETASTFDSIMRGLARDLPASLLASRPGGAVEGCASALPLAALEPADIVGLRLQLQCTSVALIIDEFDRVEDARTRTLLADTVKQISDRGVGLYFLIVGVSENLEQIIGQHPSIQRNIVPVHLPLVADADIATMLDQGGASIGLRFTPEVTQRVQRIARGMPYMAQLLGLRISQAARSRSGEATTPEDLRRAVDLVLKDAAGATAAQYASMTNNGRDAKMAHAFRAVITAPQDDWGRSEFTQGASGVRVAGQFFSLPVWNRLVDAGAMLVGPDGTLRADRALMNHALLLAEQEGRATASEGAISDDDAEAPRMRVEGKA